jgi:DNA invertase Pin-like site-specific DNA recombinase
MLIGYMRVSSADRQHTDLQRDALIAAGVAPHHIFVDHASGATIQRKGLQAALKAVKPGDGLVVWKLDRLGRSLPHLLEIIDQLRQHQVTFQSLTEQMNTQTPQGELFLQLLGALAQYERALIKERIQAGIQAAKQRGRIGGRPPLITMAMVEKIKQQLRAGQSARQIYQSLGCKRSTYYWIVKHRLNAKK